jgi:hypothetical protein
MKTFIVLGMHRSATSLVAKGLMKCGVYIGDTVLAANDSNPYGHWEDIDFVHFNDKLLAAAGGSWDRPPSELAILDLRETYADEIKNLIKVKEKKPFWGWKDPRTTLTINLYLPYLTNPHFIACYRDPREVGKSLERRGDMDAESGRKLADVYNRRLNRFLLNWSMNEHQATS